MADETGKPEPDVTNRAETAKAARAERLAGALRNNLRRRNPTERKISERPGVKGAPQTDQDENG
jgi:hypothetical protein